MGKLILVTGGARSGKSAFAEKITASFGENVIYIATAIAFDEEMKQRVKKHQERRPQSWETVEAYKDFDKLLVGKFEGRDAVMLDCITIMVTNLMYDICKDWDKLDAKEAEKIDKYVQKEIEKLVTIVHNSDLPLIAVTNEVGMGMVPEYPSARAFRDIAGRANQILASAAEEVYFCVSGIPIKVK